MMAWDKSCHKSEVNIHRSKAQAMEHLNLLRLEKLFLKKYTNEIWMKSSGIYLEFQWIFPATLCRFQWQSTPAHLFGSDERHAPHLLGFQAESRKRSMAKSSELGDTRKKLQETSEICVCTLYYIYIIYIYYISFYIIYIIYISFYIIYIYYYIYILLLYIYIIIYTVYIYYYIYSIYILLYIYIIIYIYILLYIYIIIYTVYIYIASRNPDRMTHHRILAI